MTSDALPSMLFVAVWMQGETFSGGDRILTELAKEWRSYGVDIRIATSEEGREMMRRYALDPDYIWASRQFSRRYFFDYLYRTMVSIPKALKSPKTDFVYSASDFWPDLLPSIARKLMRRSQTWIAGYYLHAEPPTLRWMNRHHRTSSAPVFYYISQLVSRFLIRLFADVVFVTSEPDRSKFTGKKVVVVRGGVHIPRNEPYSTKSAIVYDAVFIGRLHQQKGALGLVPIWKNVLRERKGARLAIIGDGALRGDLEVAIESAHLEQNIELLGFKDGPEKELIFRQSRVVLHPAIYDSGGMAPAEAMAFGLPGVAFDLQSLQSYYPSGMLKVPQNDYDAFAKAVVSLLNDSALYEQISVAARTHIENAWSWPNRAQDILAQLLPEAATAK